MNSSMIGKIEKAHRYAREPERVTLATFEATFRGEHDDYRVSLTPDGWRCTCPTFERQILESCSHIMAMQQMLGPMLTEDARYGHSPAVLSV